MTANASPEPLSNIFLSFDKDIVTIGAHTTLATFHPAVIRMVILLFILLLLWLGPKVFHAIRRMLGQLAALLM